MNLLTWLTGGQTAAAAVTIVLQVTFVLGVTCGIACLIRRNAAARHAVCLAGLLLAVACPLLAANRGAFGWTWLGVDWPVEETELSDAEMELPVIEEPRLNADVQFDEESSTRPDIGLLTGDLEPSTTESITVPPDVLYRPGDVAAQDEQEVDSTSTVVTGPDAVEPAPLIASEPVVAGPAGNAKINYATILRRAVNYGLLAWMLGVIIQTGRWWRAQRRLKAMLRGVDQLDRSRFGGTLTDAAAAVGLRRPPRVLCGALVPIPLVYGVFDPRVLLPGQFVQAAKPSELRDVLIHEFAHVARRDAWISLLQQLAAMLYWPHPLVHVLNRQLSAAREELCDNYVLREGRGTEFAEMLLTLSEQVQGVRVPVGLLGLVSRSGRLETRVAGLLDRRRRTGTRMRRGGVAVLVVAGLALLCVTGGIRAGNTSSGSEEDAIVKSSDEIEEADVPLEQESSAEVPTVRPPEVDAVTTEPAEREEDDSDADLEAPVRNGGATVDLKSVIDRLSEHCQFWINTPTKQLRSLQYTYTLGNDERRVELVRGVSEAERSMWYGSTLSTGLHWLLRHPERFDVTVARLESESNRLEMTIRTKRDEPGIVLEIGNGISGSWRGYFTHGSDEITLVVDADHTLPLHETHRFGGDPKITEIQYRDWQRVSDDGWIPRRVDVTHGGAVYHMHFAWQGGAAWLLTHAETEYQGNTQQVAQVSNVVVNDEELIRRSREEQQQREAAAGVVRTMLEHNRPWLDGDLSGLESLSYTFFSFRDDMGEQCDLSDDGTVVMEVIHHNRKILSEREGERETALPTGEWARARRGEQFALIHGPSEQENGQPYAERLRHYGRTGCQFDLPMFRYDKLLDGATVEVKEGEWNGTPSHVATVRLPGRDVYLGCGTMLGFFSTSYVHHIRPVYETIYIDRKRNVPLHETLISSWENRRFEIDFSDYQEVEPDQWAPLSIRIESPEYFTCELAFQLIEGRHWLLSEAQSWFDPEEKGRGVVRDVTVNQPSELREAALKQIEATRAVFGDAGEAVSQTVEVPTQAFELGRRTTVGSLGVLFTLNPAGGLIMRCTPSEGQLLREGQSVSVLLLDEEDRILSAAHETFVEQDGQFEALANFGQSTGLGKAVRYSLFSGERYVETPSSVVRQIRVRPIDGEGEALPAVGDESGKTRVIDVEVRPGAENQIIATVQIASQDRLNGFGLDVSVGVFNRQGELVAAGAKQGRLLVKSEIVEETWKVPLPELGSADEVDRVAVGIARGQTYSAQIGSTWGQFMINSPIFSVETMLAADDPGCWQRAITELTRRLDDDSLREEFLHDPDRRTGERVQEQRRQELLSPHNERLAWIAAHAKDPKLVAAAARMVGFAGDRAHVATLLLLLEAGDPLVRDAAAISLGLLGRDDGLHRLRAMLAMTEEELRDSHSIDLEPGSLAIPPRRWNNEWDDDIPTALLMIGSEDAVRVAGDQALADLEALTLGTGEDSGHIMSGDPQRIARLWRLLGELKQASAVDYLTRSLFWLSDHQAVADAMNLQPLIIALVDYEEQTQDLLAERIRRGDYATIRVLKESRNPYFLPAVREMMRNQETEAWTFHQGVSYLWNVGTDEAIATMVELYEEGLPAERRTRLWLCEALAYHGDDRGLPEALEVLVTACAPDVPPEDADARRKWERERDDAREEPLDVFERAKSASRIAVVKQHLEADDVATQVACLAVLGTLRGGMPESVRGTLERWENSENKEVATEATLLLQRE